MWIHAHVSAYSGTCTSIRTLAHVAPSAWPSHISDFCMKEPYEQVYTGYGLAPLLATQKPTWILGRLEEIFLTQRLGFICCNLQNHDHRHELLSEFHWLGLFKTGWTRSSPSCSRSQSLGISVWGFCWAGGDHRRTQWPGLSCKINQLNQNLILDMFATRVSPVVGDISEDFVPVRPARDRPSFQTSDQIPLWLHRFYF